jgi:TRAP-type mannitol/chloroaromatic compound transport system substrate-binding protein
MSYYDRFSPEVLSTLKKINDELINEEKQEIPDTEKILKLKQQILMKGLEMSAGPTMYNYNPYIK